jgi:hypothetical protein
MDGPGSAGQDSDDALPGQPLRAFQLVRAIINPKSFPPKSAAGEALPNLYRANSATVEE